MTLGFRALHFPADVSTRREIVAHLDHGNRGALHLSILTKYDAVSDSPICCVFRSLDAAYPGARFVLTTRDEESWLQSCENYWRTVIRRDADRGFGAIAFSGLQRRFRHADSRAPQPFDQGIRSLVKNNVSRKLGRAMDQTGYTLAINEYLYGGLDFDESRFRRVHRAYGAAVRTHFAGRDSKLLELDICGGQGWPELCRFLEVDAPTTAFPSANALEPSQD